MVVVLQIAHEAVRVAADMTACLIYKLVEIVGRVHLFQNVQIVFEASDGFGLVPWFLGDLSFVGGQSLSRDAVIAEHAPVL